MRICLMFVGLFWSGAITIRADTHYVSLSGTNNSPYLNWAGAATQIQWAVDVATNGETVMVSNGTYNLTNQIVVTNSITLQSVNGRDFTFINGNYPAYSNRCMLLSNNTAIVDGFTITNGYTANWTLFMSGVYIYGGTLQNCNINNNYGVGGGGVRATSDGTSLTTRKVLNCIINSNRGTYFGGADVKDSTMSNCIVSYNTATEPNYAGGLSLNGGYVFNSEISYNSGSGGGIMCGWGIAINESRIIGNRGTNYGGVNIYGYTAALRNCLIQGNQAINGPGGIKIGVASYPITFSVQNCTIVSNSTDSSTNAGGIHCSSTNIIALSNSIVYFNSSGGSYSNVCNDGDSNIIVRNCCLGMTNGALAPSTDINNVIYVNPLLINLPAGNCRLNANSPCINAGTNQPWMTNGVDLDGRKRIRYGTVDMGAYETIYEGSVYRIGF